MRANTTRSPGDLIAGLSAIEFATRLYLTRNELLAMRPDVPDLDLDRAIRELTSEATDELGPID